MNKKNIEKLIKERINPMPWQWGYLALKPIRDNLVKFSVQVKRENAKGILDMGCGIKPYESFFSFADKFVGFDIVKNERVDVVGSNWNLPFNNDEFDSLISTQVLEHTAKISETVLEIKRVVKNKGLIFISAPLTFPEHGAPYDFYRFTKYGLKEIFKDFEILEIRPLNGFLNTLLRLVNVFLKNIPILGYLFMPIYFINNVVAIMLDRVMYLSSKTKVKMIKDFYFNFYMGMTENYVLILRNKK